MAKKTEPSRAEKHEDALIEAACDLVMVYVDQLREAAVAGDQSDGILSDIKEVAEIAHNAKQRKLMMAR